MKMLLQKKSSKVKMIISMALILPILSSSVFAWDNYHGHVGRGYNYNNGRGGYWGGGWNGPNVIIQVPSVPYYETVPAPICDRVEVCNNYGECWIERRCQ